MRNNDEDLRQAYQSYVMEKIPDSREGCPTPEMLSDSFDPKMPQKIKDGLIAHLSRCSSCAQEFELIRESLNQAEDLSNSFNHIYGRKAHVLRKSFGFRSFFRRSWGYALISLFLISAGAVFLIFRNERPGIEGHRGARSVPHLVQPVGLISGSTPLIFRWEPIEGIEWYTVEISDESLLPIWHSPRVFSPVFAIPPAVRSLLLTGRNYCWSVFAFDKNGIRSESEVGTFMVVAPED